MCFRHHSCVVVILSVQSEKLLNFAEFWFPGVKITMGHLPSPAGLIHNWAEKGEIGLEISENLCLN